MMNPRKEGVVDKQKCVGLGHNHEIFEALRERGLLIYDAFQFLDELEARSRKRYQI